MQTFSDIISATFAESPQVSPRGSLGPQNGNLQTPNCTLCSAAFSISRLRHICRRCGAVVCGACSQGRARLAPGSDKERVCRICEDAVRATHIDEMEENADVRMQINTSLRVLLKNKYEEIEEYKKELIQLLNSEDLLQEPPSLQGPSRFDISRGIDRVNFIDIVKYVDERVQKLTKDQEELSHKFDSESTVMQERRCNFQLLQARAQLAEANAEKVRDLGNQKKRLNDTYMQQEATLRALQDRVQMMEHRIHQRSTVRQDSDGNLFYVRENALLGDEAVDRIFPCLKLA